VVGPTNHFKYVKHPYVFEYIYKKGEDGEYDSRDLELLKKLKKIQKFVARFSNKKSKTVPWHMQALKAAMQQHMGGNVVYLKRRQR
jgi:hypothetical protein